MNRRDFLKSCVAAGMAPALLESPTNDLGICGASPSPGLLNKEALIQFGKDFEADLLFGSTREIPLTHKFQEMNDLNGTRILLAGYKTGGIGRHRRG